MRREFKDGYLQPPYIRHNNNNRRDDITFCSWNVNGVNEPVKRGKVLTHLKSLQADVIFLQETHLKNDSYTRLRCRGIQHIYHSNFSVKARSTVILIRRGVPFKHPSIHHLPLVRGSGCGGSSFNRETQTSLSPATSSSSSGGTPRHSQASRET